MTVKELKARLEELDEDVVVEFLDHEYSNLWVDRESEYISLVKSCETKKAFTSTGESYGEVLMLDVE